MTIKQQVAAVAKAVDRGALIKALAAAVRKAPPKPRVVEPPPPKIKRQRMSRVGFRRYRVLVSSATFYHKRNTWTRFMLGQILSHEDTRSATNAHRESEKYQEKTLDFNWCVKQGYIEYIA